MGSRAVGRTFRKRILQAKQTAEDRPQHIPQVPRKDDGCRGDGGAASILLAQYATDGRGHVLGQQGHRQHPVKAEQHAQKPGDQQAA